MAYLLDTNIFIEAKNRYYGLDFCPAFWDWLIAGNAAGTVFSIEKVGAELAEGRDQLTTWAAQLGPGFFLKPDTKLVGELPKIAKWANGQRYTQAAVSEFLQSADYYLIAHALAHGYVVVTQERTSGSQKRIKIPDVCLPFGIHVVTPFEMLRLENAQFVLGSGVRFATGMSSAALSAFPAPASIGAI